MASAPQVRINSLQIGRGFAAIAVLFHHAQQSVDRLVGPMPRPLSAAFSYGYLGVDFFFVLSGFIIYYVSHAVVGDPKWPRRYAESRLTRVYLPYLPVAIAVGSAYVALPSMGSGENEWNWFSTLTLLPSDAGPALSPAWTLQHEVAFYAVAFLCLYLRKVLLGCVLGGLAAIAYSFTPGGTFKAFSLIDLEFIFGIFVAWCFIYDRARANVLLFVGGLAIAVSFFLVGTRNLSVIFGLGVAFMLLPIVRAEATGHLRAGKALVLLGDALFAIYLVHHPMISVLVRSLGAFPPFAAFVVAVAIPLAAGVIYHLLFEKPLIQVARQRLRRRIQPSR